MKKRLLFVIDSLDTAGAEKSLVTLLSLLDYTEYEVDLQLFAYGHPLEELLPKEVNLLAPLKYTSFTSLPLKNAMTYAVQQQSFELLRARMNYSLKIRKKQYNNPQKAMLFWQSVKDVIERNPKVYDIAISYAQGVPTYYVADKITAKKKLAWVNVSYRPSEAEKNFQAKFYDKYERIIAVSDATKENFLKSFPHYTEKTDVMYDINDAKLMMKLARLGTSYNDDFDGVRILTIGRLAEQKGYDIALKAAKLLKKKGVHFRWYVLGKGPLEEEIKRFVKKEQLTEVFTLLGVKANPYPYLKDADIYVQTSRFEGFGLALAEARMLNKPIVTTRFDAVYNQMIEGKNGLVVEMNEEAVCDGIMTLLKDEHLRQNLIHSLRKEKKGNTEEIEKFYALIS